MLVWPSRAASIFCWWHFWAVHKRGCGSSDLAGRKHTGRPWRWFSFMGGIDYHLAWAVIHIHGPTAHISPSPICNTGWAPQRTPSGSADFRRLHGWTRFARATSPLSQQSHTQYDKPSALYRSRRAHPATGTHWGLAGSRLDLREGRAKFWRETVKSFLRVSKTNTRPVLVFVMNMQSLFVVEKPSPSVVRALLVMKKIFSILFICSIGLRNGWVIQDDYYPKHRRSIPHCENIQWFWHELQIWYCIC